MKPTSRTPPLPQRGHEELHHAEGGDTPPPGDNPRSDERLQTESFLSDGLGRDVFYLAVTRTRMPMVVTDPRQPDNPIVFANEAFLDLTGYTLADVMHRNCRFLQGPETDRDTVRRIREQLAAGQDVHAELLNYRKNGSSFWNALFVSPLRDADGTVIYFFSSQLDVSRRRDAEDSLRQAQKMEALGQLTGGIAHDFNNLLQVIGGHLEIIRRRIGQSEQPQPLLETSVERARDATRRSARLTQQLLAFARKQQLRGRVINVNALVESTCRLAADTLGDGYAIRTRLDPRVGLARIDPTQAELALLNVMINARDAMPAGGTITVRTDDVQADGHGTGFHNVPAAGRYVRISVTDEGSGIPASLLPRVMDPFFTTKPEGAGTGLGLSMVYGFAKQSRGAVNLYSEEGVGTTVSLYFPVADETQEDAEPARGAARSGDTRDAGARILVVDDRIEVAELTATMLAELGHATEVCHDSSGALAHLRDGHAVDLLLTDIVMPGHMNGLVLAQAARALRPGLPVLLMTGFADDLTRHGADGRLEEVIVKPFTTDELDARVRRLLQAGRRGAAA